VIYTLSEICSILKETLTGTPVRQAVLFGSYAKGCPNENSDLDLVIDMDGHHRGFAFWGVYEDLREAFSIPVELFEKSEILPGQEAEREIRRTGVVVYDHDRHLPCARQCVP
jgi:predicted nucleotidyltransferase